VTALVDNLRNWKLHLEQRLDHALGAEERQQIEGKLFKIDTALSFLG
jgi:hypothetical protein